MGREKGGRLSFPRFPPSHHTPRATKERQRERRLGKSQARVNVGLSVGIGVAVITTVLVVSDKERLQRFD